MADSHDDATAREALRDVARFAEYRRFIADHQATAEAEGRWAWARLAGHTLDSIRLGVTAAGSLLSNLATHGVDVHRIAREVLAERKGA